MVDGNIILYESRAIVTYLVDKYAAGSSLYPRDIEKRAMIDNLLMFDIGTLYKTMSAYLVSIRSPMTHFPCVVLGLI
ncbi:glutathione S-transferase 1-1-like [Ixodes scapularis]|uniref:glutathione S-transferase 1-1-like n=1 Tax=Ixodes scapularis TaxID=6945 RepID=UPI001A9E2EBF|nr:glutathione S-transferase 1-1-like [Ixodes scapularis]